MMSFFIYDQLWQRNESKKHICVTGKKTKKNLCVSPQIIWVYSVWIIDACNDAKSLHNVAQSLTYANDFSLQSMIDWFPML